MAYGNCLTYWKSLVHERIAMSMFAVFRCVALGRWLYTSSNSKIDPDTLFLLASWQSKAA